MNRYLLPLSVLGTVAGGAVLLRDYVAGGSCPSKATILGKTVIVTGANTGIGKQTALELAKRGGNIILACRDMEKCEAAARDIRRETLNHHVSARHLDLASLKSIREFAAKITEEKERVHILINNAAVMRCPHWTTEDGFEMQFGVNHLGHFLLTNLLLDTLKASAPSRIVNLSSLAHVAGHVDFDDLNWEKRTYDTKAAYCQSKLAVVLFTKELSRRLQGTGVTVNALHPGVARTELGRHTGMHSSAFSSFTLGPIFWLLVKSPQLAAQPSTYLAVAEELEGVSGKYFDGFKEKPPAPEAEDEEVAVFAKEFWLPRLRHPLGGSVGRVSLKTKAVVRAAPPRWQYCSRTNGRYVHTIRQQARGGDSSKTNQTLSLNLDLDGADTKTDKDACGTLPPLPV